MTANDLSVKLTFERINLESGVIPTSHMILSYQTHFMVKLQFGGLSIAKIQDGRYYPFINVFYCS